MNFDFLQYLPKEQQEKLGTEMAELLMARALKAFHAALSENTKKSFEAVMQGGDPEAQVRFLGAHQSLFQKVIIEEGAKLEKEIDAGMESNRE